MRVSLHPSNRKGWFNLPKVEIITTSLRHSTWLSLFMLQELSQTKHTFQVGEFWWYSARKCWVQSDSSSWVLSLSWKWYFNSWLRKLVLFIEGSFEVKLPTIWTDEKQSRAEAERRGRLEERRSEEKRKSKRTEDTDARKGRKVAKQCVFPMIWGSGGSKSRLAKAAGAEPAGQRRDEKLHAVVARSTFWSQNVQNTSVSDHFWKLRCRKSARRCGAKHILKSKCTKHLSVGWLLEVEMSKKCTPLWREAHFEVKMYKAHHPRSTFGSWDVEKVHAVVARSTFWSQKC